MKELEDIAATAQAGWLATALNDHLDVREVGLQRQTFVHGGSHAGVTARWVVMPPGHITVMHRHPDSVIVVSVVRGHATTLAVSPTLELMPEPHGPGDVIIIDRGVLHLAANLSDSEPVVVSEIGTSEHFHHDVIRHEEWDNSARQLSQHLREKFHEPEDGQETVADLLIERLLPDYTSTR
ncbi:cupin domain-containing protein [Saccharothrix sp. AJ9571]|nr:cupin domain-containing protein [Saccharothrix sp. AJ9571]